MRLQSHFSLIVIIPLAWLLQLILDFAAERGICYGPLVQMPSHQLQSLWIWALLIATNLASLGLFLYFAIAAAIRLTSARTSPNSAIETGEGLAEYISLWFLMMAGGLLLLALSCAFTYFLVPLCR